MNGAPQLFFSRRAPARWSRRQGARAAPSAAQSKKKYRRGPRTGARSELVRVPVPGKSAVRVRPQRFFLAGRRIQKSATRSTRWGAGGLGDLRFWPWAKELVRPSNRPWAGVAGEEKRQRIRVPRLASHSDRGRGRLRLESTSRSAWPRHTAKRLALAAPNGCPAQRNRCQSTLDAIEQHNGRRPPLPPPHRRAVVGPHLQY